MKRRQYVILVLVSFLGGLVGGIVSNHFIILPASAEKSPLKKLRSISAEKFVVTDKEGDIRAVLGMIEEAPSLMMFGKPRNLPRLMIFDSKRVRAELFLRANGAASLDLFDEKGTMRTALGTVKIKMPKTGEIQNLSTSLVFFDETGSVLWSAP